MDKMYSVIVPLGSLPAWGVRVEIVAQLPFALANVVTPRMGSAG